VAACLDFALASQRSSLPDIEWRFQPGWLALSVPCLLAFQWMHIELWRGMLHSLGGTLPRWKAWSIWSTTLLARYVPTSALMAVGRIALSQREGVSKRVCTASVAYEVAFTFIAAVAVSTYLVLTLPAFEEHSLRWLVLAVPVAGVAVLAMTHALHEVPADETAVLVASYSLGFAAGVIAFVLPGALGAREAGVAVAVATAVPAAVALAVALVVRLVQIGVELLYAGVMP